MDVHVHLGAAYSTEPWVEHFDWLAPLFSAAGKAYVCNSPGLRRSVSDGSSPKQSL